MSILNSTYIIVQVQCHALTMMSGKFAVACLDLLLTLSMIAVRTGAEMTEGIMIPIDLTLHGLVLLFSRIQTDIRATRVAEEKIRRSLKTELLLKTNTVRKKVHRNIPIHETNIRFLRSDLERVIQPSCLLSVETLS